MSTDENKLWNETPDADVDSSVEQHDGRNPGQYKTRYPHEIQKEIRFEAVFLYFMLFIALLGLYCSWSGLLALKLSVRSPEIFNEYICFACAGILGGTVFGMKYFYRVVAHGFWHQDRKYWRFMSPFVAMIVAMVVGAMANERYMQVDKPLNGATTFIIGFLAGYFADEAVGKMFEIACVIFGTTRPSKDNPKKLQDAQDT